MIWEAFITTSRRDTILSAINKEGQPDFRGIMRAIKSEATETGGAKSKNDLVEEYKNDCSEELRIRMEGVMRRDAMGPHEGTVAPTFDLKRMGSDERVDLSSFKGDRPIALTFSSYTWPPFRGQVGRMNEIYNQYKEDMAFFFIYVREAHPTDGWQVDANVEQGILFRQHQSIKEREEAAGSCTVGLEMQLPTLIEEMDNGIDDAYGAAPVRQYVVGKDGVVAYHGGAGPHFLDLDDWEEAIKSTIS